MSDNPNITATSIEDRPPNVDVYRVVRISNRPNDQWSLDGRYVEHVWCELLGPTATLLARRLGDIHERHPDGIEVTREIRWHQTKPTGAGSLAERIAKKLESEERIITSYGGTRVRIDLDRIPLWTDRGDIAVEALWKAY